MALTAVQVVKPLTLDPGSTRLLPELRRRRSRVVQYVLFEAERLVFYKFYSTRPIKYYICPDSILIRKYIISALKRYLIGR